MQGKERLFPKSSQQVDLHDLGFQGASVSDRSEANAPLSQKAPPPTLRFIRSAWTTSVPAKSDCDPSPYSRQQALFLDRGPHTVVPDQPPDLKAVGSSKTVLTAHSEGLSLHSLWFVQTPNSNAHQSVPFPPRDGLVDGHLFNDSMRIEHNDDLLEPFRNMDKFNLEEFSHDGSCDESPDPPQQPNGHSPVHDFKICFPQKPSLAHPEAFPSSLSLIREELLQSVREEFSVASEEPVPGDERQSVQALPAQRTCCTCKKSKCLQRYCECFRSKGFCSGACSCTDCFNAPAFEDIRDQFFREQLERNPQSFSSKIVAFSTVRVNSKGCNCKKSSCMKNYCECFAAGVRCSELCHCVDCLNPEGSLVSEGIEAIQEKAGRKKKKSEPNFREALMDKLASRKNTRDSVVGSPLLLADDERSVANINLNDNR